MRLESKNNKNPFVFLITLIKLKCQAPLFQVFTMLGKEIFIFTKFPRSFSVIPGD